FVGPYDVASVRCGYSTDDPGTMNEGETRRCSNDFSPLAIPIILWIDSWPCSPNIRSWRWRTSGDFPAHGSIPISTRRNLPRHRRTPALNTTGLSRWEVAVVNSR